MNDPFDGLIKWTSQMLGLADVFSEYHDPDQETTAGNGPDSIAILQKELEEEEDDDDDEEEEEEDEVLDSMIDDVSCSLLEKSPDGSEPSGNNSNEVEQPAEKHSSKEKHEVKQETVETDNNNNNRTSETRMVELIIQEIISTEKDYVNDLERLLTFFFRPITTQSTFAPLHSVITMQSTCEGLLEIHSNFIHNLSPTSTPTIVELSQAFDQFVPFFKIYSTYCGGLKPLTEALNEARRTRREFGRFLTKLEIQANLNNLNIPSTLIKPAQRICKYPLFFKSLLHHPLSTSDELRLESSLDAIERISTAVNESVKAQQNNLRLFDLRRRLRGTFPELVTPTRKFLLETSVRVCKLKPELKVTKPLDYQLILFTDILLLAKANRFNHLRVKRQFHLPYVILKHLSSTWRFDPDTSFELLVVKVPQTMPAEANRVSKSKEHGTLKRFIVTSKDPEEHEALRKLLEETIVIAAQVDNQSNLAESNRLLEDMGLQTPSTAIWSKLMAEIRQGKKEIVESIKNRRSVIKGVRNIH